MWPVVSRGKRSVRLDVREPAGQDTVRARSCDVDVLIGRAADAALGPAR